MAVDHYENFPVASLLLPARLREPVKAIYRYARSADDIADEGDAPTVERLAALLAYEEAIRRIEAGQPPYSTDLQLDHHIFQPLARAMEQHDLPAQPFLDLLSAFAQDVSTTRYADEASLLDYCRRSADPVGRLMLHLYEAATPANITLSDAVCTGLQLTNFWQDVALDWSKNRIYLPLDALHRHGLTEDSIRIRVEGDLVGEPVPPAELAAWSALMREQVQQARDRLVTGAPLARHLPWRIGLELRMVVQGGLRILERLDQLHYDVFKHRPTLGMRDWLLLSWRALSTPVP